MYAEIACFGCETKKCGEKIGNYAKQKPTLFRFAFARLDFSVSFFRCTTPLIPPIASGISEISFGSFGGRDRCAVARAEFSIFLFDNARRRAGRPVARHLDWISNDIQITFNLVSYRWMRVCVRERKKGEREKERKLIETARACMLSTPMLACGSRLVRGRGWDIRILLSTIRFIKTARHLQTESTVCFARSTARGKTEARYNNRVSPVCKQNYRASVANVTQHQFLGWGEWGGEELQVVTTIWHLPKSVVKINPSIPIFRDFQSNMDSMSKE